MGLLDWLFGKPTAPSPNPLHTESQPPIKLPPQGSPPRRFVDNGDGTVTDNQTQLVWQLEDDGAKRNYFEAEEYCQNLTLGGHSDWRVPTIKELSSVASEWGRIFQNPKNDEPYWSSTIEKVYPKAHFKAEQYVAQVMFSNGSLNEYSCGYKYYTRAVRKASGPG